MSIVSLDGSFSGLVQTL